MTNIYFVYDNIRYQQVVHCILGSIIALGDLIQVHAQKIKKLLVVTKQKEDVQSSQFMDYRQGNQWYKHILQSAFHSSVFTTGAVLDMD
jgi:hypothetical protein